MSYLNTKKMNSLKRKMNAVRRWMDGNRASPLAFKFGRISCTVRSGATGTELQGQTISTNGIEIYIPLDFTSQHSNALRLVFGACVHEIIHLGQRRASDQLFETVGALEKAGTITTPSSVDSWFHGYYIHAHELEAHAVQAAAEVWYEHGSSAFKSIQFEINHTSVVQRIDSRLGKAICTPPQKVTDPLLLTWCNQFRSIADRAYKDWP